MKRIRITIVIILFLSYLGANAQLPPGEYTSLNKKAIQNYEMALKYYNQQNDEKAKEECGKAIEKDANFIEPHLLLAEIYTIQNKMQLAIDEYVKSFAINPGFNQNNYYNVAQLELKLGKYEDAKKDLTQFLKKQRITPDTRETAELQLASCNFAIEAMKHPVPFEPKNLGPAINSPFDEYFPAITADDRIFLYTRIMKSEASRGQEDFYISKKNGNEWAESKPLYGINTASNEGAPSISADGELLFFVACQDNPDGSYAAGRKGLGSCDIFYSQRVGDQWSIPYNIGQNINSKFWDSQPSFSSDGKTLYFVSSRLGGMGDADIYYSFLKEDGSWAPAKNIGATINTKGKEESVFIHPDNQTLYFSSNGHSGMGGLDIYISRKDVDGKWGTPINLGYPINSYTEENSLLVNGAGNLAYFASNRNGGFGGLDLYQFELYKEAQPNRISYMRGKVYDAKTKQPLGAHFELLDLESGKQVIVSDANSVNGEFLVTLPINGNYALNVTQAGYLFHSENFSLKELKDFTKPYLMDVPMQPIDTGSVVELKNIFFETAKFDLKPESKVELNKLIAFLNLNKTMKIELDGHTDNVGDKKSNQVLSQNRAKSVFDYLVVNGILATRLAYKGFGDTRPKVKNDSDVNRAINRRTEFKVVGK
jgi:outer membrane protein OmpA-like peptidoglycan-associated protein/tetratricopeptide (TPR) repeat protein